MFVVADNLCSRLCVCLAGDAFVEIIKEMNVQDGVAFLQHRQSARQCSAAGAPVAPALYSVTA